jgi:hypothetical protein
VSRQDLGLLNLQHGRLVNEYAIYYYKYFVSLELSCNYTKVKNKGYSKGYQHSRTHKPDESYGENSQQADICRERYEEEEKEFLKS